MINYLNYGRLWRVYGRSLLRYGTLRRFWNALRTEVAYRRRQVDVRSVPYVLHLEPLYFCNLSCPLCDRQTYPEARRKEGGRLPMQLVDRILEEIGDDLIQCQLYGLGEPLLDWPLTRQIVQKAHTHRIFTVVYTNATLIRPEMAEEIVTSGLDYIACAIDGVTQETYGRYRVGGKIEQAFEGLRLLCEARRKHGSRIDIEWQYLVNRHNAREMEQAQKMADEMGVYLRFANTHGIEGVPELQEEWLPETGDPKWQAARVERGKTIAPFPCYYLWRSLVVNSNGQMARCPRYPNTAQVGAVEGSIRAHYNSPETQRARQLFVAGSVPTGDFPMPCNNCAYFQREHGGPNINKQTGIDPMARRAFPESIPLELRPHTAVVPRDDLK